MGICSVIVAVISELLTVLYLVFVYLEFFPILASPCCHLGCIPHSFTSRTTDAERGNSLHRCMAENSLPLPKFLGTAEAYFVCHIGPFFQILIFDLCLHWVSVVHVSLHCSGARPAGNRRYRMDGRMSPCIPMGAKENNTAYASKNVSKC